MDFRPKSPARVAFSFAAGTFDLRAWCPGLWYEGDHGRSTAVWLDDRWDCLLDAIRELGFILSSVRSGPMSLAAAWQQADFQQIPGTHELIEWHTGTEMRRDRIGAVNAVVEEHSGQQMASLQFFDRQGIGCLKLMLTDASQVDRFKDLLQSHATLRPWGPSFTPRPVADTGVLSRAELNALRSRIEPLWSGLERTQPGDYFPGLAQTSRLRAIESMEGIRAWKIPANTLQKALEWAAEQITTVRVSIRNHALLTSAECTFLKSQVCGCGQTFFGHHSQMTLRHLGKDEQFWAVEYHLENGRSDWRMEAYDKHDHRFMAQVSLSEHAEPAAAEGWQQFLCDSRLI